MKKKTTYEIRRNLAIFFIIILIACLILLFWFKATFDKFNPDKDICEEEKACIQENTKPTWVDYTKRMECCDGEVCYHPIDKECSKWRPKTKCELNPIDKDCICDEYDIPILGCVKSHKANECEKLNPNYIWYNETYKEEYEDVDNCCAKSIVGDEYYFRIYRQDTNETLDEFWTNSYSTGIHQGSLSKRYYDQHTPNIKIEYRITKNPHEVCSGACITHGFEEKQRRICRKKTIKDLSCEELKNYYIDAGFFDKSEKHLFEYLDRCIN